MDIRDRITAAPEMLEQAVADLLNRIPETWQEYRPDDLTETQSQGLRLLVAAGMVERRERLRLRMANHPLVAEATITCTGEYGGVEAMKPLAVRLLSDWQDAFREWKKGETANIDPVHSERLDPSEWRLIAEGILAKQAIGQDSWKDVFDYIVNRDSSGGHPQPVRPPVRGHGKLVRMEKKPATVPSGNGAGTVHVGNWAEGGDAFAQAFVPMLTKAFEAMMQAQEAKAATPGAVATPTTTPGAAETEAADCDATASVCTRQTQELGGVVESIRALLDGKTATPAATGAEATNDGEGRKTSGTGPFSEKSARDKEDGAIRKRLYLARTPAGNGPAVMPGASENEAGNGAATPEAAETEAADHIAFLEWVRDEVHCAAEAKRNQLANGYPKETIQSMLSGITPKNWAEARRRVSLLSGLPCNVVEEVARVLNRELTIGTAERVDELLTLAVTALRDAWEDHKHERGRPIGETENVEPPGAGASEAADGPPIDPPKAEPDGPVAPKQPEKRRGRKSLSEKEVAKRKEAIEAYDRAVKSGIRPEQARRDAGIEDAATLNTWRTLIRTKEQRRKSSKK